MTYWRCSVAVKRSPDVAASRPLCSEEAAEYMCWLIGEYIKNP
ncbi:hypothetical protein [Planktothricoides sp. SR001]|nr:hypothetical protein [Planktothricoides sp. SR001]